MPFPDPARILRASKLRMGPLRSQGVPAILFGVAGVVLAAGTMRVMRESVASLPFAVRELRSLVETARAQPKVLNP